MHAFDAVNASPANKYFIDDETMRLVRYFISRNQALSDFDDDTFKDLLSGYKRKIPCSKTFKSVVLDDVYMKVEREIEKILQNAQSICLISDLWTSKSMLDFMGIAVNVIYSNFEKETIVIGLELMSGAHNAENIKIAIERIVNRYKFNKAIIHGKANNRSINVIFNT